jgi:hypothetical protein
MLDIAIVILNWNGVEYLKRFLPKVADNTKITDHSVEIVIADNASTDNSIDYVRHYFPSLRIIQLDENYGFAKGYDLALNQIKAKYFVLLNSDVETPSDWLYPLVEYMEKHPQVAATMPKIKWYKDKHMFEYAGAAGGFIDFFGYTFCQGRLFDTLEMDDGQYNIPKEIFWASGACFMIRSEIYFKAGGLDHRFFAHMEEIDLCWRIHRLGYKIYYIPESEVFHVGGGTLPSGNPFKTYLNFRNNLILIYKNLPSKGLYKRLMWRLILDFIAGINLLLKGNVNGFLSVFKAHWKFYGMFFKLKKERGFINYNLRTYEHIIYFRSIVFDYFFRRKRRFTQLDF